MNELLDYLRAHNFDISTPDLNGKFKRFNRDGKKNAWFVGHQFHSSNTGEAFIIATFGDWKTGEQYTYRPQIKLTKTEQSKIDKQVKADLKAQTYKAQDLQNEIALACETIWETASEKVLPQYLTNKKLSKLYGTRSNIESDGRALYIPCRDVNGKLWGIQKVHANGDKYFSPGQRVQGTFHAITDVELDQARTIYIAEGFSTAATIYEAVKKTTIAAFNAANLVRVAKEIKVKYPHTSIVICGDDDHANDENTGAIKAQDAANAVMGIHVLPKFKDKNGKTDFNDLYIESGLESVKKQLLQVNPPQVYVIPLGFKDTKYYYTSSDNKQIVCIGAEAHNKHRLMDLMPMEYWLNLYPNSKHGVDWDLAENTLKKQCRAKRFFKASKIRGSGCYEDNKRFVINTGQNIFYDGHHIDYHDFKTDFIYQISKTITTPTRSCTTDDIDELLMMLRLAPFKHPDAHKYLFSFLFLAPICGALPWRPHVWVTGPAGSGKSYLMSDVITPILKPFARLFQGPSTEAGIRQTMRSDSMPIIFDEFETNNEKSSRRVETVLEYFRQASSDSDADIVRGTISGSALTFNARFSACVASIQVNLMNEADRSRFTPLELQKGKNTAQDFARIKKHFAGLSPEFGKELFALAYGQLDNLLHNYELFRCALSEMFNARVGQQLGMLIAGHATALLRAPMNETSAKAWLKGFELSESKSEALETDQLACWDYLMDSKFRFDGHEYHIQELCFSDATDRLKYVGMRKNADQIYIRRRHPELTRIFKDTPWKNSYARTLSRLPDASRDTKCIGGKPAKCIVITR